MADEERPVDNTPPGVDPALWAEFDKISDRVHELANWNEETDGPKPPSRRIVIDLPQEWLVLLAWMSKRHDQWLAGKDGATGYSLDVMEQVGFGRLARYVVRPYLHHIFRELMLAELSQLCWGNHFLLRPRPPEVERTPIEPGEDDDEIPF